MDFKSDKIEDQIFEVEVYLKMKISKEVSYFLMFDKDQEAQKWVDKWVLVNDAFDVLSDIVEDLDL